MAQAREMFKKIRDDNMKKSDLGMVGEHIAMYCYSPKHSGQVGVNVEDFRYATEKGAYYLLLEDSEGSRRQIPWDEATVELEGGFKPTEDADFVLLRIKRPGEWIVEDKAIRRKPAAAFKECPKVLMKREILERLDACTITVAQAVDALLKIE